MQAVYRRLHTSVDVLIQISENYYVMSEKLAAGDIAGYRALHVTRSAVGLETVSRIYRLTDRQPDAETFPRLRADFLTDLDLLDRLFGKFNYDGRKDRREFDGRVANAIQLIEDICASDDVKRVRIFRQRYTGHLIPEPRELKKFGPIADVHQFSSAELRRITDGLSEVISQLFYLHERSTYPYNDIARLARNESLDLWNQVVAKADAE